MIVKGQTGINVFFVWKVKMFSLVLRLLAGDAGTHRCDSNFYFRVTYSGITMLPQVAAGAFTNLLQQQKFSDLLLTWCPILCPGRFLFVYITPHSDNPLPIPRTA